MKIKKLIEFKKRVNDRHNFKVQELSADIEVSDEFQNNELSLPLEISGVALTQGIHKDGVYYSSDELSMAAGNLIGKFVILKHNKEEISDRVGKVTKAWFNSEINGIEFEAWVEDEKIASKIYHGLIDAVSVGVQSKRIPTEEGISVATDLRFTELSLVSNPADINARIQVKAS